MWWDEFMWWNEEVKAYCPKCGTPHVAVRPGKTQPNCECDTICDICGGKVNYHTEDPRWPRMSGEWCDKCGPFPGADDYDVNRTSDSD
jgi:hypothetical protein